MVDVASRDPLGLVGTLLDKKYRVDAQVAEGGFGVVYAGRHIGLGRPVAIKVPKRPADTGDAEWGDMVGRFLEEARLAAKLRHPAVVSVLDAGVTPTEAYPGGVTWMVAAEATATGQTLKDPDVSGGTKMQVGYAGDINTRVKINRTRLRMDLSYRDLAFILHSTPSLPTYSDFPPEYVRTGDFFAAVGADQNFAGTGLTLGLIAGVDMPATLQTPTGAIPGDMVDGMGESTAVVRNEGDIVVLPPGEDALPQLALKFTGRLDFADSFAALTDVYYVRDPNQTRLVRDDPESELMREFGEFNQLGFNFTLQAKF